MCQQSYLSILWLHWTYRQISRWKHCLAVTMWQMVEKLCSIQALIASNNYAPPPQAPIIISLNSMQVGGVGSHEALINLEFNSTQISIDVEPLAKKQRKNYDAIWKWQDIWAAQFDCTKSKWLMACWYLSNAQCVTWLQVGSNTLCLNTIILKNTWGNGKQTMTFLAKGWRKMRYITTRTKNMLKILPCLVFYSPCLFCNKLAMLLLGKINARLSSLPLFFMFWKMVNPWLNMNV